MKKEMFDNVIIFSIAEPGAPVGGWMDFVTEDGKTFSLNYLSKEITWDTVIIWSSERSIL